MMEKILERLEEEREIAYADFDKYASSYELNLDDTYDDFFHKGLARAKTIVQEVAKEYSKDTNVRSKLHTILDYLQFVRDNADKYDSEDGWELSDLIILATEYQKGE